MSVQVEIVNAFVDGDTGGNPAGVVLDADGLSHAQKLTVAQRVGLSETAFVSASEVATFKLDFYTPTRQIAHCGHATIAAFCRLRELGRIGDGTLSKETVDGRRDIIVRGDTTFMEQRSPTYVSIDAGSALESRLLDSLRIEYGTLTAGLAPAVVNTGNAFLVIPVCNALSLAALQPDMALVSRLSDELDLVGYYAYTTETRRDARDAGARMFAPRYGIDEESATGMAAGPLACYLRDRAGAPAERFVIEQGWFMRPASPSVIRVDLKVAGGSIQRLLAGGRARSMRVIEV